jgi:hypothetical protein
MAGFVIGFYAVSGDFLPCLFWTRCRSVGRIGGSQSSMRRRVTSKVRQEQGTSHCFCVSLQLDYWMHIEITELSIIAATNTRKRDSASELPKRIDYETQ